MVDPGDGSKKKGRSNQLRPQTSHKLKKMADSGVFQNFFPSSKPQVIIRFFANLDPCHGWTYDSGILKLPVYSVTVLSDKN